MKSLLLLSFGFIASALCAHESKSKVFTKPLGLDTQDLCARMPDGVLIADSDDCRLFYYCLNYEAEPIRCRSGYYFDKETSYCLPGNCPAGTVTYCNEDEDKFTRINGKCTSFNVCHNGVLVQLECPIGTYFDDYQKTCVAVENNVHHQCACIMPQYTTLANERNCHSYFVCTEGKALSQLCQRDYFFNEQLNSCVPDVRGQCATNKNSQVQGQTMSKPVQPPKAVLDVNAEAMKPAKPSVVIKDPKPPVVATHTEEHKNNQDHKETDKPIEKQTEHKNTEDHKTEIKTEHKDKPTENHVNKPTAIISDADKQEFLDNIREQLISKKQHITDVHNAHKDKVVVYEKCVLGEEKDKRPDHPKPEHQNIKPIVKETNKDLKPANKLPTPTDDRVYGNGVYNKLNSKFMIP